MGGNNCWLENFIGEGKHNPRGLVPLEILFDTNDVAIKPTKKEHEENTNDNNIGRK